MNKIIQINLSGRLILIDEKAHEGLQYYLQQLRNIFSKEEAGAEIINDIEDRIAELFREKLNNGLAHISENELDQVMQTIGKPEDLSESISKEKDAEGDLHNVQVKKTLPR